MYPNALVEQTSGPKYHERQDKEMADITTAPVDDITMNDATTPDILIHTNDTKCFPWNNAADKWWEMHPDWTIISESNDALCFAPIKDKEKAAYFRKLHDVQYNSSNCDNNITKHMWSSGYGSDISNVADGLAYGLETGKPFQITMKKGDMWHYAGFKKRLRNGREPVCASADMFCYFLPIGICKPSANYTDGFIAKKQEFLSRRSWLREFATRPQQWFRRRIMEYITKSASDIKARKDEECAAIHIRRTDVVLHDGASRKYFSVEEYLNELKGHNFTHIKNILLFTDDANAIDEAQEFHPEYNWMYLEKKRHRGSEGGWENQIPGNSPADEMIALLSVFRLAQQCDVLIHTESGFSTFIYDSMISTGRPITRLRPDSIKRGENKNLNNTVSEVQLKSLLNKKRNHTLLKKLLTP